MRVEFAVPSPSDSSTDYQLDMGGGQTGASSVDGGPLAPPSSSTGAAPGSQPHAHKNLRRVNTFTGAPNEEEQRNIISLRYRADRYRQHASLKWPNWRRSPFLPIRRSSSESGEEMH
jgi:hypothetical protein